MGWAWWDWPLTWLTNHRPSVLWHCWSGHVTRNTVSEMTYNVSSGTLNSTILYYYRSCDLFEFRSILLEDDRWAGVETLNCWFLNSFWGGNEIQKGHSFRPSFIECTKAKNRKLSDSGRIICRPDAENHAKSCQWTAATLWCVWCEYKHGDARLTTLSSSCVCCLIPTIFAFCVALFLKII